MSNDLSCARKIKTKTRKRCVSAPLRETNCPKKMLVCLKLILHFA